jgi:viologen exporter family transport system permease protein
VADSARVYLSLVSAAIRAQWQYRTAFVLDAVGMFFVTFLDFVAVLVIFHNVPRLGDFTVAEVAFLYALSAMAFALAEFVVGHLDVLSEYVRTGSFDVMLARPRGTLFQVLASDFRMRRLGQLVQGAAVFVYAVSELDIPWNAGRVGMVVLAVLSGAVIFSAIWVFVICIVFWAVEGRETASAFTYGGQYMTQFPIDVYSQWLRRFLAFIVPTAFVAYFPALYILDKDDPFGLPSALSFASPLVAVLAALAAGAMWRFAVRHYRSAGG